MTSFVMLLLVPYGIMTLAWFGMLRRLYRYLSEAHPSLYTELGSPTLFTNNTISNGIGVIRLLSSHSSQTDPTLARRLRFLYRWILATLSLFMVIVFGLLCASATDVGP